MGDPELTPTRMTTRGVTKNYAELSTSGDGRYDDQNEKEDAVFRSPSASTRGRKRRVTSTSHDDSFSEMSFTLPRRGRPRGSGTGPRGPRGGGARRLLGPTVREEDDKGLFGAVRTGKNIDGALDEWMDEYEVNPDTTLVKMLQVLVSACGCKGVITSNMISASDYSDIVRRLTEEFEEDSHDYPIVQTGPQWRRFRHNYGNMLVSLIHKCKQSIIFDQRLMDSVIQLLTGLADSQVRAFRHTATFAAMRISSALVDVTIELASSKDKNAKQIETEKTKVKQQKGGNEKLDMLINKKAEIEERTEDVRQMLAYIFKSVFVHRYRDIIPDVRAICVSELGQWMHAYPEHFLDDSFLKYIGWSLYDKMPEVRIKCMNALQRLFIDKQEMLGKLELFTNKFKDRLVAMVMDRDTETSIRACQLMTCIYRVFPSLLQPKDCVPIYELVYCNNRGQAIAAGEFLNTKVFQHSGQRSRASSVASNAGRVPSENASLILDLVRFFIEGECHEHAAYLVDALIDTNPMMKDWGTMCELLLSSENAELDAQLVDVLACAAQQAATGEPPVGRSSTKKGHAREQRNLLEDRTTLSEALIPALPLLINKFIADRERIALLCTLPKYFQLDMYLVGRKENHLMALMGSLETVVERHTDEEVLTAVAATVAHLSAHSSVEQHISTHVSKMLDGVQVQVQRQMAQLDREEADDEDEAAIVAALKKITAFGGNMDLHRWDVWDCVLAALGTESKATRDVRECGLLYLYEVLVWDLNRLTKETTVKQDQLRKLRKRRDQFLHIANQVIAEGASGVETAFLCVCDVLTLFNAELATHHDHLSTLVVQLDADLASRMQSFVDDNVFVEIADADMLDQQQQIELMHKKRSLLAQYCKLILHGVLPISDAAVVLRHYIAFYHDFGDILKLLLYKLRDVDMVGCAKAVVHALIRAYEEIKVERGGDVDPLSDAFHALRDLAKRFAGSFGSDHTKNREAIAIIHREGILFALEVKDGEIPAKRGRNEPGNVVFFEALMEFSNRLVKQDKAAVLKYLEKHGSSKSSAYAPDDVTWSAYFLYKDTLKERLADDQTSVHSFATTTSYGGRGRGRGRGRGGYGRATPALSEIGE